MIVETNRTDDKTPVIDFDLLEKGDYIEPGIVEKIVGMSQEHRSYGLACMGLRAQIERHFAVKKEMIVTVKCEESGVRILTDNEASVYNHNTVKRGARQIMNGQARNLAVDASKLSDQERRDHDRRLVTDGAYAQAVRKVKKQLEVTPNQRKSPGLPACNQ